ncbi:hypothetical protein QJS83_08725 [Bdellovibrio sp. 22V]|uniref:hypothetical protein n=1 Tax=Bdellovibrio sp. 22V TaxID=3044166 RepID=UPI002542C6B7|nr:hypothetical protein [Bdellovibrio sp. 22V]WII70540.1 hypothetical protein QJS83_08725 [Bdellovibrio sp. 22V]
MKVFISSLILALAAQAQAATVYQGTIDLRNASNHARIPTEINAGLYSVEVSVESSPAKSEENIALSKQAFSDDNEYVCNVTGQFKVGQFTLKVRSLTTHWESETTTDVYATFGSSQSFPRGESTQSCRINTKDFEGVAAYSIHLPDVTLELPIKDARFSSVKLRMNPIAEAFLAQYELLAGTKENTLQVLAPGAPFESALQSSGNKNISYELGITTKQGSYLYFGSEKALAQRVK